MDHAGDQAVRIHLAPVERTITSWFRRSRSAARWRNGDKNRAVQDGLIIRTSQAHIAHPNNLMPEVPKRLRHFLVEHLVEEKQAPVHACSGSSSVCSMTEWQ